MAGFTASILRGLDSRCFETWAAIFYFAVGGWVPAMYLIHSVASSAVWPLAINQSIKRAASVAVMLASILSSPPAGHICLSAGLGYFYTATGGAGCLLGSSRGLALCRGHGSGFSVVDRSARAGGRGLVCGCQGACGLRPPCVACFVPSCACRLRPGSRPAIVPAGALPCCPWPAWLAFGAPDCDCIITRCSRFVKPFFAIFFRGFKFPRRGKNFFRE